VSKFETSFIKTREILNIFLPLLCTVVVDISEELLLEVKSEPNNVIKLIR